MTATKLWAESSERYSDSQLVLTLFQLQSILTVKSCWRVQHFSLSRWEIQQAVAQS